MSMRPRGERGATAVIVAGSLIMIMGIAAIAIDGGQAFSERRQAQTGVDFAALAALQGATSCPSPCTDAAAADAGASEAQAVVAENLPGRTLNWAACTDPNRPGKFSPPAGHVASTTPCVSFTSNFDEARVVLPIDSLNTSFARVIGRDTVDISAFAEAGQDIDITSSVVPFAFGGGTSTCLFSNQASQTVPPCDRPNNGNFGYIDIAQYGNDTLGTSTSCGNTALARIAPNIAIGTDHLLGVWNPGDDIVNDRDACPNRSETPNQIEVQPGSPVQELTNGLVRSNTPKARLHCDSGPCQTVRDVSLNDTPLWAYLTGSHGCGSISSRAQMIGCLDAWNPGKGVIFSESIANNRRLVAVPRFTSYPSTGFGLYEIRDFIPVYLDTVYARCNATKCDTVFSPGFTGVVPVDCPDPLAPTTDACGYAGNWRGGTTVEGLTAFTIDSRMLPGSIMENFPNQPGLRVFNLTE